jgi:hypothetical protein
MYVKFATGWLMATTADSLKSGACSDLDKLTEALFDRDIRTENARIRNAKRRERSIRTAEANAAAKSTEHLIDELEARVVPSAPKGRPQKWSSEGHLIKPFSTEDSE